MTEEQTFQVMLVHGPGEFAVAGNWLYRADELPERRQIIEIHVDGDPENRRRCRVTRLEPDSKFPVRATEL